MDQHEIETVIRNIDERTSRIEQILPTLATRKEVEAAVQEEGQRTRLHFDGVAERIEGSVLEAGTSKPR